MQHRGSRSLFFNGLTGQAGMTVDGVYRYTKEADQITIPPLPKVPYFQNWRQSVRELVVAASRLGPVAFGWTNKVEDKGIDLAQLADSTRPFVSIALKLKAALSLVLTGDLLNKVIPTFIVGWATNHVRLTNHGNLIR